MNLRERIYKNLVKQFMNIAQTNDLRGKLRDVEREADSTVGQAILLADLYKEETGRDLQHDLNTSEEWAGIVERANKEATATLNNAPVRAAPAPAQPVKQTAAAPAPAPAQVPAAAPAAQAEQTPRLRKVTDNKKVPAKQAESERREPIKVVIEDAPAPAPGEFQRSEATDFDEDDGDEKD